MERIASRLGDQNLQIDTHDPELQDRKDQLDSNIRRNIVEITGYEFLPVGEEQNPRRPQAPTTGAIWFAILAVNNISGILHIQPWSIL